jgi:hypothetical protein
MTLILGSKLTAAQRREVLAAYVHRHLDTTCKDDDQWLAAHAFYVTRAGRLARNRSHCEPAFLADDHKYDGAECLCGLGQ